MKKILIIFFASISSLMSAGTAGTEAAYESRYIIDMPTAGVIPKGGFGVYSNSFNGGGLMVQMSAAPFENFNMSISYSGSNIIGVGDVRWQDLPGVSLRYRIINEDLKIPALTVGVSIQGRGVWHTSQKRFETMSPGIYAALSKSFEWYLGGVYFHGGLCYSFEPAASDRIPNFWLGLEQTLGTNFAFCAEFNACLNEPDERFISSPGLLNMSLKWAVASGLTLEFQARDLLESVSSNNGFNRALTFEYISAF